jgi:hypothetical protein
MDDERKAAVPGTVGAVVGRELIDNLILKLTTAYLHMEHDDYTEADIDTLSTLWRHQCCQDALNRAAGMMKANYATGED